MMATGNSTKKEMKPGQESFSQIILFEVMLLFCRTETFTEETVQLLCDGFLDHYKPALENAKKQLIELT